MFAYFYVFSAILILYLLSINFKLTREARFFLLSLTFFVLLIFIGLRHEVGGDWSSYLYWFNRIDEYGLELSVKGVLGSDMGYNIVNFISSKLNLGIYGVNTICALFFLSGLFVFISRHTTNPFFGLMIAYPYLIMVVATGYTRQSVALGFVFLVYTYVLENKLYKALFFAILAFTFHKTGIISLLLLFLNREFRKRKWLMLTTIGLTILGFGLGVFQYVLERFYRLYVLNPMRSEGGTLRALTILLPASLFLFFNRTIKLYFEEDNRFWYFVALSALGLSLFSLAKLTFADRMLLYFYPIQIVGFDRLRVIEKNATWKAFLELGIVLYSLSYMTVWLLAAVHREAWVPYDNLITLLFNDRL